jgi:hypothetical protein
MSRALFESCSRSSSGSDLRSEAPLRHKGDGNKNRYKGDDKTVPLVSPQLNSVARAAASRSFKVGSMRSASVPELLLRTLCVTAAATATVITFTGDVTVDFPSGPGVFVATDSSTDVFFPHPSDPLDPYSATVNDPTGWNIRDVR